MFTSDLWLKLQVLCALPHTGVGEDFFLSLQSIHDRQNLLKSCVLMG